MKSVLLFFALFLVCSPARAVVIHLYHTNDIHGWIMARPAEQGRHDPIGGAAAMAAVYRKDRGPKLLVDAGDWFQGTPEGSLTKGRALADVFNAVPYDAVAVGNHEFDFGESALKDLLRRIKIPVLSANIRRQSDHERVDYVTPWVIKDVAGVKIGIFGLLTTNMKNLEFPQNIAGLEFRREVDEAKDAVETLRARGATVIVALTHVGFESAKGPSFEGDQTLASEVAGIDVIVGGHTHTFLKKPVRDATHGTLIVQAGRYLSAFGEVTLDVDDRTGQVARSSARLINLWLDRAGQDPQIAGLVAKYRDEVGAGLDVALATAPEPLAHGNGETPLGDWATDCERDWARTDLAFENAHGLRDSLAAGPVTRRDIFNIVPFENAVVKLSLKGRDVAQALEHGVSGAVGVGILQISGAKVSYNSAMPPGRRLVSVKIAGEPLDPERDYSVALVDFLVSGGNGFSAFDRASRREATGMLLRGVLEECAARQKRIVPPAGGRIVDVAR